MEDEAFVAAIEGPFPDCVECLLSAGRRPAHPLEVPICENDDRLVCFQIAVSYGVAFSPGQIVLAASLGDLKLVRYFHGLGQPLWARAHDRFGVDPIPLTWEDWVTLVRYESDVWQGVLSVPPTDEHLPACWATLRYGSLHGAPLTPRAEGLVRERRACAQEVLRCFHAARWRAGAGRPDTGTWAAMSRVPLDVLIIIMELAEVEIYEAVR